MSNQSIKPSAWYYGLASLVVVVGGVSFGLLLYTGLHGLADSLTQVVVPGKAEIALSQPGTYTVFYEYESTVGNKVYSTGESLSGLQCNLVSKVTGAPVKLSRPSSSTNYSVGGRSGKSVLQFTITQPGRYEFSADYSGGQVGPEVVLAIGRDFTGKLLATILGSIAVFFGSFVLAIVILAVTFIKRQKAKKQLAGTTA